MLQEQDYGEEGNEPPKSASRILIALGGNLTSAIGSPEQTLRAALVMLKNRGAVIRNVSPCYHTPAFPAGTGPKFTNAAAELSADWSPAQTLAVLHAVEADLGRERSVRWGERAIDLDLIAHGEQVLPDLETHAQWRNLVLSDQIERTPDTLILPHPRVQERAFVLVPLADIAPEWSHPVLKLTVQEMRDALPADDLAGVRPVE